MTGKTGTAIVIGSGMAGLLAARVLSDHFTKVLILERDPPVTSTAPRPGAPQGNHVHALLVRGQQILEALLPGFEADLLKAGAQKPKDAGTELKIFNFGRWAADVHLGFAPISMTRGLLESVVRRRVTEIENVTLQYNTTADELILDSRTNRITGVVARQNDSAQSPVAADFVVDAAGRGAFGLKALKSIGCDSPVEEVIGLDFGYATALFDIPEGYVRNWSTLLVGTAPPESGGALLMPVEGNRWLVSLAGRGKSKPPSDPAGFLEFARALPNPALYEVIASARLVGEVKSYRFPASVKRRFDLLTRHPECFLSVGDALCSLNPIYGQGMSVSAMEVEELHSQMRQRASAGQRFDGLGKDFYSAALKIVDVPWKQTLGADLMYEETIYPRPRGHALQRRIAIWAQKVIQGDPDLRVSFIRMLHFIAEPGDKLTLSRLLASQVRQWINGPAPAEAPVTHPLKSAQAA